LSNESFGQHNIWPTKHLANKTFGQSNICLTQHLTKAGPTEEMCPIENFVGTKYDGHDAFD
jgi:hypothetical protein